MLYSRSILKARRGRGSMNNKGEKAKKKRWGRTLLWSPDEKVWGPEVLLNLPGRIKGAEMESRSFSKVNLKGPGDCGHLRHQGERDWRMALRSLECQEDEGEMQFPLLTSRIESAKWLRIHSERICKEAGCKEHLGDINSSGFHFENKGRATHTQSLSPC